MIAAGSAGCRDATRSASHTSEQVTLTLGVGQLSAANQEIGLGKIARNIALEQLVNIGRDGRVTARFAESWNVASDGTLRIRLRPNVKFHDGTPVTAAVIAQIVQATLPDALGPALPDLGGIRAVSDNEIEIAQKRSSPFLLESLDFVIEKPGARGVGTGPFSIASGSNGIEMRANEGYYLGRPAIQRILLRSYPTVRAAWADMLRGQVDMLYEVGLDARESLQSSSKVAVYSFPRSYAYVMMLNPHRPALASADVRRALDQAIDRSELIRDALNNRGTPADGPVWPRHWAYKLTFPAFGFDPLSAAKRLGSHPRFKCTFAEGALYERLALATQKQLAAVGVDMQVEAVPLDDLDGRLRSGDFDGMLLDAQLGPNIFRSYQFWHSGGTHNAGGFSSAKVDAALDMIRYAVDDAEYASGVLQFQQAVIDDPPAIFLAWGERARAVSRRFEVPPEPERDVATTLRLWKLAPNQQASRN